MTPKDEAYRDYVRTIKAANEATREAEEAWNEALADSYRDEPSPGHGPGCGCPMHRPRFGSPKAIEALFK